MSNPCSRCQSHVENLLKIDVGMRLALQASEFGEEIPDAVCPVCYSQLSSITSRGAKLRAEQSAREQNVKILWRNRIKVLKGARAKMKERKFTEAAVLYEKYLRVVDLAFQKKDWSIAPTDFTGVKRKEITAMVSVYWDLIRIYDTGSRYDDKIGKVANKLVEFFPYSRGQVDLAKRIQAFSKTARNSKEVKEIAKKLKVKTGMCFVATAVYGDSNAPEVLLFRNFRDDKLSKNSLGQLFISTYYKWGPSAALWLGSHPIIRRQIKYVLDRFAKTLAMRSNLK